MKTEFRVVMIQSRDDAMLDHSGKTATKTDVFIFIRVMTGATH